MYFKDYYKVQFINPFIYKTGGIPRNGLAAEWLFSGNYDDTSGNGRDGTVAGTGGFVSDRHGNPNSAYDNDINLSTNYIDLPNFKRGDVGLTISLWVNFKITPPGDGEWLISYRTGTGNLFVYQIALLSNTLSFSVGDGISQSIATSDTFSPTLDTWYHILGTTTGVNGNDVFLYVDNSLFAQSTLTFNVGDIDTGTNLNQTLATRSFQLGVGSLDGYLDDIRIYNRFLDTSERNELFNE